MTAADTVAARQRAARYNSALSEWTRVSGPDAQAAAIEAFRREDWRTLGYASWDDYLQGEFGSVSGDTGVDLVRAWAEPEPKRTILADSRTVYFVQPAGGGLIKIGVAENIHVRLAAIQSMSPVPLRIVGLVLGRGQALETELHKRFAAARRHGEWFEPVPELLAYIKEHAS